ncbi:hypothetical protein NONO_c30870 [Nocardia nova SH22a]|uniref:Uncharacterized protein n=1 Tax=Nocardia nova SH22a TaxID=1415166 RepID=W5TFG9_9NOCA|nr:hypothetical protein NONO_c30870 [Nocardia nova SH22a]
MCWHRDISNRLCRNRSKAAVADALRRADRPQSRRKRDRRTLTGSRPRRPQVHARSARRDRRAAFRLRARSGHRRHSPGKGRDDHSRATEQPVRQSIRSTCLAGTAGDVLAGIAGTLMVARLSAAQRRRISRARPRAGSSTRPPQARRRADHRDSGCPRDTRCHRSIPFEFRSRPKQLGRTGHAGTVTTSARRPLRTYRALESSDFTGCVEVLLAYRPHANGSIVDGCASSDDGGAEQDRDRRRARAHHPCAITSGLTPIAGGGRRLRRDHRAGGRRTSPHG